MTEDMKKLRFNCDILTLVGEFSQNVKHKPSSGDPIYQNSTVDIFVKSEKSASFVKFSDVGNVLLEAPERAAKAILSFAQGLGLAPNVLRRTDISRGSP